MDSITKKHTDINNQIPWRLWQSWANCPWHFWLSGAPEFNQIIIGTLTKLPMSVTTKLLQPVRPLVVLPPVTMARAIRVHVAMAAGANIVQINPQLVSRPMEQAQAIFAHELGHLLCPSTGNVEQDDIIADRLVIDWGFGSSLILALETDLGNNHIRTVSAKKYLSKSNN